MNIKLDAMLKQLSFAIISCKICLKDGIGNQVVLETCIVQWWQFKLLSVQRGEKLPVTFPFTGILISNIRHDKIYLFVTICQSLKEKFTKLTFSKSIYDGCDDCKKYIAKMLTPSQRHA